MGVSPVRFDGKDLYIPGYYGKRDISKLNVGAASGSRLLLLGECKAGVPYNASTDYPNADDRVNWVSNTKELKDKIRDGKAYTGALFALTPSNEPGINGAPAVGVIRVNKATKGEKTIVDIDTDNVLKILSAGYGLYVNQIQFKISAGTNKGKKVTVKFEADTLENDDITYELMTITYSGTAANAILEIDPAGNLKITTANPSVPADDIDISLASYDTINAVGAYLNAHSSGNYTAVLVGDGEFECSNLDKVVTADAIDVKTTKTVSAILKAVEDYFNLSLELLNSEFIGTERRVPANMANFEFLSGGSEGAAVTQTEWQEALDMAKMIDASFVVCMTSDDAIGAALGEHCTYMSSSEGRNERQGIYGAGLTGTKSAKIASAAQINNALVGYCGTEVKRYDKFGNEKTYEGYYKGAMIAGMSAGNAITFAPTNKPINIIGQKEKYGNTDLNDYIKGGVMVSNPSELGGIRVVRSITTYQGSNIIANEWSAMRTILYITKDHRAYVQGLIGEPGDDTILESIKNRARLRLEYYQDQGWFVTDPQYGNAFRNYTFEATGDVIKISYEATIVVPVNFILVNHNFTVIGFKG